MPDQPPLDEGTVDLRMELQSKHPVSLGPVENEGLVREPRCGRQCHGPGRDHELVPVPVQHRHPGQRRENRPRTGNGQFQRGEPDLSPPRRTDLSTQRRGDELRAETDPENRSTGSDPVADQVDLGDEEGVGVGVPDPDRTTENNQQGAVLGGGERGQRIDAGLDELHLVATTGQKWGEGTEVLEKEVPDDVSDRGSVHVPGGYPPCGIVSGVDSQGQAPVPITGSTAAGIADSIRGLVDLGLLAPGDRLPPVRGLADTLGVNRNTVQAAYRNLVLAGVAVSRRGAGTTVADLAEPVTEGSASGTLGAAQTGGRVRDIGHGNPDPSRLPDPATVRLTPAPPPLYGTAATHPELGRVALRLLGPDLADRASDAVISVTAGAVDAIERLLATVVATGDAVALEDPCFLTSVNTTRLAGYRTLPVLVDAEGMDAAGLSRALQAGARAVVCTPRAHNPTGVSLTRERASALQSVLVDYPGVLVIEDDQFSGLSTSHYETVIPPGHIRWALVRSMSKSLGPDLRTALVASDPETAERLSRRINGGTTWVSHLLQRTVAALLSDADVRRDLARTAEHYAERHRTFLGKLRAAGLESPSVDGLNIWVDLGRPSGSAVAELRRRGWVVRDGALFRLLGSGAGPDAVTLSGQSEQETHLRLTVHELGDDDMDRLIGDLVAVAESV